MIKNIKTLFYDRQIDFDKLQKFGFVNSKGNYIYSKPMSNKQFDIRIVVSKKGEVTADVIDVETKEPYVLVKVQDTIGKFVGSIRSEFESTLMDMVQHCSMPDIFKSDEAKEIVQYVRTKYKDELEFLWEKFPKNAIFRRKDNKKWYAALLTIPQNKIGLEGNELTEIIDLRIDPTQVESLVDGKRYFPGYHMNKKHWVTICLNKTIPLNEIFNWIDSSYIRAKKG